MADRSTDPGQLARRDRGAHAGAADEHAALGLACEDRLADLPSLIRVVDSRLRGVRPEIDGLVPRLRDRVADALAELDPAVVEGNGDAHRMGTLPAWPTTSAGASWASSFASTPSERVPSPARAIPRPRC